MSTTVDPFAALNGTSAAARGKTAAANEAGSADRFLKLLVTQMQNQDPLSPMDNAQITSQIAQINTVSGIGTLNTSIQALSAQFVQMQAVQGASLVGRDITIQGNRLAIDDGQGVAGFELDGTASRVKVEVLSGAGRVVDTLDLGTQTAGVHGFSWRPPTGMPQADLANLRFRVVATNGTAMVGSTPLMRDRVDAVSLVGDKLQLDTSLSGRIPYTDVKAFN